MLTRFGLQSTQTGLISSAYDIGSLVVMIPVSYYGGRPGASKPRAVTLPPTQSLDILHLVTKLLNPQKVGAK